MEHGHALTLAEIRLLKVKVPEIIIIIAQHSGEVVYIPPGWVHAVINMRHRIMFAVDMYVPTHMRMYAFSMALVGSPYTKWRMVTDHMYVQHATVVTFGMLWANFMIYYALALARTL